MESIAVSRISERDQARFAADVAPSLATYTAEHPTDEPPIHMDEATKRSTSDVEEPIAMAPGRAAKEDYHHQRHAMGGGRMWRRSSRRSWPGRAWTDGSAR